MKIDELIRGLPGEDLVRKGLADNQAGRSSVPACLVAIASQRLSDAGLLPVNKTQPLPDAELTLYRLLRQEGGDAYSRYNALVRELASFANALDQRRERLKAEKLRS